jgi:hypothetical protein
MLAFLGDRRPQKSSSNLERTTSPSGEAATIAGRVGMAPTGNEHRRPGTNLNPSNRPVRTRMPGGVAGDAEASPPRPYADWASRARRDPLRAGAAASLHAVAVDDAAQRCRLSIQVDGEFDVGGAQPGVP